MPGIFLWKKKPQKKHISFVFLKDRYFVMGRPIGVNIGVF